MVNFGDCHVVLVGQFYFFSPLTIVVPKKWGFATVFKYNLETAKQQMWYGECSVDLCVNKFSTL